MDFKQYQDAALSTALPTARNLDYLIPGLIAEIGECFGKVAKARRDEWDESDLEDDLVKEWGDCAWMTAVALHTVAIYHDQNNPEISYYSLRHDAMSVAMEYAITANDLDDPAQPLQDVWDVIVDGCEVVTGRSIEHVLRVNLDKLADRQARGVVGGSGDTR